MALIKANIVDRSLAPTPSEYWKVNVCCSPLPEFGDTGPAVTPAGGPGDGTVQVPRVTQPLLAALPAA